MNTQDKIKVLQEELDDMYDHVSAYKMIIKSLESKIKEPNKRTEANRFEIINFQTKEQLEELKEELEAMSADVDSRELIIKRIEKEIKQINQSSSKKIKISNSEVEQVEGDNTKLLFWFNDSSLILIKGVAGALYATFEDDSEENFIFDWVLDERENAPDYYNNLSKSEKIILGIDYALEQNELKKFHGLFNKYCFSEAT